MREPECKKDHLLGQPVRRALQPRHSRVGLNPLVDLTASSSRAKTRRRPRRLRHPLARARGPTRRRSRQPTPTRFTARPGRRSGASRSTPSPRMPAPSTTTTRSLQDYTGVVAPAPTRATGSAQALGPRKAVILRDHGNLTVGASVDEAVWWFITIEERFLPGAAPRRGRAARRPRP